MLTGNENVPRQEWTFSPGMGMCLIGNAHPHQECISSPRMHIVYRGCYCDSTEWCISVDRRQETEKNVTFATFPTFVAHICQET